MKAFLLAAGLGTRLRPYTEKLPKCLLPIGGIPMLEIWLSLCSKYGISDVLVNTHAHSAAVADFFRSWRNGVKVTVVEEPELFGSAGTLRANRSWLGEADKFWVFYADVLTNVNLASMLDSHSPRFAATLGVYSVPDPERCGIVCVNRDKVVVDFVEKPAVPQSRLAFAGIMIGTRELLDAIPDKRGTDIAYDILPHLIGRMRAYAIPEFVLDIGTLQNYEAAQKKWLSLTTKE
ncbi:MAG TPA: nucleotidyltransferase family protein [Terriglobales bacterium]